MKHSISHSLGKENAKKAAVAAFDSYQKRFSEYEPRADWVTDDHADISFKVKGFTLKGAMEVQEQSIDMDLDVPFVLKPFKSKALGVIETEIRTWIAKAEAGEI